MRTLRVALAQIDTTVGDLKGNTAKIVEWIGRARDLGADIVALPELARDRLSARGPRAAALVHRGQPGGAGRGRARDEGHHGDRRVRGRERRHLQRRGRDLRRPAGVSSTTSSFCRTTACSTRTATSSAATSRPSSLSPASMSASTSARTSGTPTDRRASRRHAGAEVIININASPYHRAKGSFREGMISTRANDNAVVVCYVNVVGGQDELVFDGHSVIFDETGICVARAAQFREDLLVHDVDVEGVMQTRLHDPRQRKERLEVHRAGVAKKIAVSERPYRTDKPAIASRIAPVLDPVAEVCDALVLGIAGLHRQDRVRDGAHRALRRHRLVARRRDRGRRARRGPRRRRLDAVALLVGGQQDRRARRWPSAWASGA